MALKVGDKVKFLNDVGGGVVVKIKQLTIYVETSDGFEIPTVESELLKIEEVGFGGLKPEPVINKNTNHNKQQSPTSKHQIPEIDEIEDIENDDSGLETITSENCTLNILMGLVPIRSKGTGDGEIQVYMISDCDYRVLYSLSVVKDNFVYGRKVGMIEEDTKIPATIFSIEELKEIQSFKVSCIFYKKGIFLPHEPIIFEYKVDALWLANPLNWHENDYFNQKAIIVNITEESLIYEIERTVTESEEKLIIQKKRKDVKPQKLEVKSKPVSDIEEVDLHIEQLVENHIGMSNGEIMDIQMSRFNIALEGAIRNKIKSIVFIHGVGNGKLKYEIRKTLDSSKYSHLRYQDASFKEYGFGATMVILR